MGVGVQRHAPGVLSPGKTQYLLYKRLGLTQGRSRSGAENLAPTEFDPRTIQPITSRYTDCAIPANVCEKYPKILNLLKYLHFLIICLWG